MFSSRKHLEKKTGPYGVGRLSFLQSLVTEYQDITDDEAKEQVLANLANFAYDPINYPYLRQLNVIDLFLDALTEGNDNFVEFGIAGICNLCLDRENKEHILKEGGVKLVVNLFSSSREDIVVSALTTLMYLVTPASKQEICSVAVVDAMLRFAQSKNPRISNLATVFLQDYCSQEVIQEAQAAQFEDGSGTAVPAVVQGP